MRVAPLVCLLVFWGCSGKTDGEEPNPTATGGAGGRDVPATGGGGTGGRDTSPTGGGLNCGGAVDRCVTNQLEIAAAIGLSEAAVSDHTVRLCRGMACMGMPVAGVFSGGVWTGSISPMPSIGYSNESGAIVLRAFWRFNPQDLRDAGPGGEVFSLRVDDRAGKLVVSRRKQAKLGLGSIDYGFGCGGVVPCVTVEAEDIGPEDGGVPDTDASPGDAGRVDASASPDAAD